MGLQVGLNKSSGNIGDVKLENSAGVVINPATEDTLVKIPGLWLPEADSFSTAYPNPTTTVYSFFTGGLSGTKVATQTLVYTDATHQFISSGVITKP